MKTRQVDVQLGANRYQIEIGNKLLEDTDLWARLVSDRPSFLVSNPTVMDKHGERLRRALPELPKGEFLMRDGEQFKSMDSWQALLDGMLAAGLTRDSVVLALGGGVVGDLAGFAAASYMRGIDVIQIPTTLLAQVDSSVGGKTGINHARGKNLIGAFHQPCAVVIDVDTLVTLPTRERAAGMAEVVKYGLIDDAAFFHWLEQHQTGLNEADAALTAQMIAHSCACKARVVAADELERGQRALLNLGHTFGHALEAVTEYRLWLHGEAVALGMLCAAHWSHRQLGLAATDIERIATLLRGFGLPVAIDDSLSAARLVDAMQGDKKADRKGLRGVSLPAIGAARIEPFNDQAALIAAWRDLGAGA